MRDHFMMNLWRWKCGLREVEVTAHRYTLTQAMTNWFPEFVRLMRNRMLMGIYRHGHISDPNQPDFDRVGSALHRLHLYVETGNGEHLVDVANLCGIEFEKATHPRFHFTAQDDAYHTEVVSRGHDA